MCVGGKSEKVVITTGVEWYKGTLVSLLFYVFEHFYTKKVLKKEERMSSSKLSRNFQSNNS
jgi:hypothetical protein